MGWGTRNKDGDEGWVDRTPLDINIVIIYVDLLVILDVKLQT